jgi:hypothetical protein
MEPDRRAEWDGAAALTCLCAVLAAAPYFLRLTADPDLWWHLKTGLLILDLGSLPRTDPFSFTYQGAPWFNHEWLAAGWRAAIVPPPAHDHAGQRSPGRLPWATLLRWVLAIARLSGPPAFRPLPVRPGTRYTPATLATRPLG